MSSSSGALHAQADHLRRRGGVGGEGLILAASPTSCQRSGELTLDSPAIARWPGVDTPVCSADRLGPASSTRSRPRVTSSSPIVWSSSSG